MIHKIGYFVFQLLIVAVFCSDNGFGAFLSNLLEYLIKSLFKEVTGVGAFLRILSAAFNYRFKVFKYVIVQWVFSCSFI